MKIIFLGFLIICCLFSSFVVKSNECLPKEGCNKVIDLVLNSDDASAFLDTLPQQKRQLLEDLFFDHCIVEECKTDICGQIGQFMDDFNRAPPNLKSAFNDLKQYFMNYCGLKINIGLGVGIGLGL